MEELGRGGAWLWGEEGGGDTEGRWRAGLDWVAGDVVVVVGAWGGVGGGGNSVGFSITGRKLVSSHAPAGCL